MANKTKKKKRAEGKDEKHQAPAVGPWISMKTGLRVIAVTSIVMAGLTTYQAILAEKSWLDAIMWGAIFGGLIWIIFFGLILINRFLR